MDLCVTHVLAHVTHKFVSTVSTTTKNTFSFCQATVFVMHLPGGKNSDPDVAEPLWTDPGLKSGTGLCELSFTKKNKHKKPRRWRIC